MDFKNILAYNFCFKVSSKFYSLDLPALDVWGEKNKEEQLKTIKAN